MNGEGTRAWSMVSRTRLTSLGCHLYVTYIALAFIPFFTKYKEYENLKTTKGPLTDFAADRIKGSSIKTNIWKISVMLIKFY